MFLFYVIFNKLIRSTPLGIGVRSFLIEDWGTIFVHFQLC